jgi:hypothetical protein
MTLTTDGFWTAINSIDKSALDRGEEDFALAPLMKMLVSFSCQELEGFEQNLHEALFTIDGEDFFNASGETSGDVFLYCRCYVIAKGLQFYTSVLQQPILMPNKDCESLLYVASETWAAKTGREAEEWPFVSIINYETGGNLARWSKPKTIELTPAEITRQYELNYDRALSSVVHAYHKGRFEHVVKLLTPYSNRLSKRFSDMLQEAKARLAEDQ